MINWFGHAKHWTSANRLDHWGFFHFIKFIFPDGNYIGTVAPEQLSFDVICIFDVVHMLLGIDSEI